MNRRYPPFNALRAFAAAARHASEQRVKHDYSCYLLYRQTLEPDSVGALFREWLLDQL